MYKAFFVYFFKLIHQAGCKRATDRILGMTDMTVCMISAPAYVCIFVDLTGIPTTLHRIGLFFVGKKVGWKI
jgi:hypothetical protein